MRTVECVKVCLSRWRDGFVEHRSVTNEVPVIYKPGVWTEPVLEGSKLFAFETLLAARMMYAHPEYEQDYMGISFWEAEAQGVRVIGKCLKAGCYNNMRQYWENVNRGAWHRQGGRYLVNPAAYEIDWKLEWKGDIMGVLIADRIRILNMVSMDHLNMLKHVQSVDM